MGTREVLGEEEEMQASGKMFTKLELGEYRWLTYNQVSSLGQFCSRKHDRLPG